MRAVVLALMVCCGASAVAAEPARGAVESASSHEPGAPHEALEEEHRPRHGGAFGDADDLYHYEVLFGQDGRLILYVNDEHNRPLDARPLQGTWTLDPDGDVPVEGTFASSPDGAHLIAQLPAVTADPVHVEVSVRNGDRWAPMEFYLPNSR